MSSNQSEPKVQSTALMHVRYLSLPPNEPPGFRRGPGGSRTYAKSYHTPYENMSAPKKCTIRRISFLSSVVPLL